MSLEIKYSQKLGFHLLRISMTDAVNQKMIKNSLLEVL